MTNLNFKVLVTASGVGQKIGELTQFTNKSLLRIGKKPALSYIIESYPQDTEFVVTLGHYSEQVRDFIKLAYPNHNVEFVEVDKYSGEGSSLGYSMLKAKDKLQCPFIYHASDTIVTDLIPIPDKNWIGVYKGSDASQYSSWKMIDKDNISFNDKGAVDFDYIHIGLVGINDYGAFWNIVDDLYKSDPLNPSLGDTNVIVKMIERNYHFSPYEFSKWFDIGNVTALHEARKYVSDHFENLDKIDESIFIFDDFVIKFFYDEKINKNRVERAKYLKGLVPEIEGATKNFYRYKFVPGDLYSRVVTPSDFGKFLEWAKKNLWKKVEKVSKPEFNKACKDFYLTKTEQRIDKFFKKNSLEDVTQIINGDRVPKLKDLLSQIDFDKLSEADQYQFHGDFILENIIKTKGGYTLVDWRQDFGGLLEAGDIYYDLAKLNHNLTVNHDIINQNLFTIKSGEDSVECDILRKNKLVVSQEILFEFVKNEGYNVNKVKLVTALIWLNMAPLHHHPFNLFLFYFGKWNLWRILNQKI